jgi:hypothetical protein
MSSNPPGPQGPTSATPRAGTAPGDFDILDGDIAAPDEVASSKELALASHFAGLIDKAIAGRTPPALASDERALLEVATTIRSVVGRAELAEGRRRELVDDAFAGVTNLRGPGPRAISEKPDGARRSQRLRARSWLPWTLTATTLTMAAAAIAALWMRPPHSVVVNAPSQIPTHWRSRGADAVVGEIRRENAARAADRLDSIYSDRLDGYREAMLFRGQGAR